MSTIEKVRDITVEQLSVDADEVKMESAFIDDLGADSLDIVELIMAFEEEFGVEIPDEKAEKIRTVAAAGKLLAAENSCFTCLCLVNPLRVPRHKLLYFSPEMGDIC